MLNYNWEAEEWGTEKYQLEKQQNFESIDQYINTAPTNILDIGCGFAWESRMFQRKHNSKLWLLDGNPEDNNESQTEVGWNTSSKTFAFYHSFDILNKKLEELGTKNYELIDVNNMVFPEDLKFDLITSFKSCGFHYPVTTYKNLILKHSHPETKIIFDLRTSKGNVVDTTGFEIVNILTKHKKHINAEIKFI
jgi:SAM-dependent methyltransferase